MPVCPKCRTEYEPGIKFCADCNIELEDIVLIECGNCEELVNQISNFCPYCGFVLKKSISDSVNECTNHPKIAAIGACIICWKPVCEECAIIEDRRVFCDNDEHIKDFNDWAVVYTCGAEYEADMVKANIEMAGIKCLLFSQKDNVFFTNIGDTAIVNVMVPKVNIMEAKKIIDQIDEGNFEEGDIDDEDK